MLGIRTRRPPPFGGIHINDDKDIQIHRPEDASRNGLWAEGRLLLRDLVFALMIAALVVVFIVQPVKVEGTSMLPRLHDGERIFVNKLIYYDEYRWAPKIDRGDIVVFWYPDDPSKSYIKRVVGIPGDEVAYLNKRLTINGKLLPKTPLPDFFDVDTLRYAKQFEETNGDRTYRLLNDADRPSFIAGADNFPYRDNCRYSTEGVVCKVPQGRYFMMGDNRDNSLDSRYWGFVPEENIVGKAFFVWMNFGNLKRIGSFQ